jgi:hypothetical protein
MTVATLGKYDNYTSATFLDDLDSIYFDRIYKLALKDRLGKSVESLHFKAFLLTAYYEILVDYCDLADVTDTNFFDEEDITDILQHFNNIAVSRLTNEYLITI